MARGERKREKEKNKRTRLAKKVERVVREKARVEG